MEELFMEDGYIIYVILILGLFWWIYDNIHTNKQKTEYESLLENPKSGNKQTPTNKWKKEYESLLENPKWENKRQKILNRDKHKCVYCGSDIILQVHHKYYEKYPNGTRPKPWDYPDDALVTVCKNCHEEIHAAKKIKSYYRKKGKHYEKS